MSTDAQETPVVNKPTVSNSITLGNIINLLPILVLLASGAMIYGQISLRLDNADTYRSERSKLVDARFDVIGKQLEKIPMLEYKAIAAEEQIKAQAQRNEAALSNVSARLAEINQTVGSLDRQIAVLTQRLEMPQNKRADLLMPTFPPRFAIERTEN